MIPSFLARNIGLILGTLYPAYASYKAVRTKNVREYVKWMMYWIVFAIFSCFETFADIFVAFWFPFYYELKIVVLLWLISPVSRGSLGSSILYRKFVHPALMKREDEIDHMILRLQEQGYNTVTRLAARAFHFISDLIMQTAIRNAPNLTAILHQDVHDGRPGHHQVFLMQDGGQVQLQALQNAPNHNGGECEIAEFMDFADEIDQMDADNEDVIDGVGVAGGATSNGPFRRPAEPLKQRRPAGAAKRPPMELSSDSEAPPSDNDVTDVNTSLRRGRPRHQPAKRSSSETDQQVKPARKRAVSKKKAAK